MCVERCNYNVKFTDFITKQAIIAELSTADKKEALEEIVKVLRDVYSLKTVKNDAIISALLKRERIGSTGIGNGVAVPHTKLDGLKDVVAIFARSSSSSNVATGGTTGGDDPIGINA